jgi:phenylalanyl-tRNA synthetase alpha chain
LPISRRAPTRPALENSKARYLGKAGALTDMLKSLGKLSAAERPLPARASTRRRTQLEAALDARREAIADAKLAAQLAADALDVSLPGRGLGIGGPAPAQRARSSGSRALSVRSASKWPTDPRSRTTSTTSPRSTRRRTTPRGRCTTRSTSRAATCCARIRRRSRCATWKRTRRRSRSSRPGRVYRVDSDATHSPMFHQIEGLWIDTDVTFADLKSVITEILRNFFERDDLKVRFRPSFFPFTEPSAEIDMSWGDGWLEICGAGTGASERAARRGHRSRALPGFRVRHGPDRLTMLRYGVNDLRAFYENDLAFLRQFT